MIISNISRNNINFIAALITEDPDIFNSRRYVLSERWFDSTSIMVEGLSYEDTIILEGKIGNLFKSLVNRVTKAGASVLDTMNWGFEKWKAAKEKLGPITSKMKKTANWAWGQLPEKVQKVIEHAAKNAGVGLATFIIASTFFCGPTGGVLAAMGAQGVASAASKFGGK